MGNLKGFNANEHEDAEEYELLPVGEYEAMIIESEMRDNSAGTGSYLALTFEITDGEKQGRRAWLNLNLDHPNETAVKIAQRQLAEVCRAVGVEEPDDSTDLHDVPVVIKIKHKRRKDTGEMGAQIGKVRSVDGGHASAPATKTAPSKGAGGSLPWRK